MRLCVNAVPEAPGRLDRPLRRGKAEHRKEIKIIIVFFSVRSLKIFKIPE